MPVWTLWQSLPCSADMDCGSLCLSTICELKIFFLKEPRHKVITCQAHFLCSFLWTYEKGAISIHPSILTWPHSRDALHGCNVNTVNYSMCDIVYCLKHYCLLGVYRTQINLQWFILSVLKCNICIFINYVTRLWIKQPAVPLQLKTEKYPRRLLLSLNVWLTHRWRLQPDH